MRSAPVQSGRSPQPPAEGAPLGAPLLVVNLKVYPSALGPGAERIGRALQRLGESRRVAVALAPAHADLGHLAALLRIPMLAQHVAPHGPGARTGTVVAESLRASGARGSLINHSEYPLPFPQIREASVRLRWLGLVPILCAGSPREAGALAALEPPYLAIEPPELVGGRRSVSTARPGVIVETVRRVRTRSPGTRVLCGAGVHDRHDVARALELGSQGVLVASAVAASERPARALAELLAGF